MAVILLSEWFKILLTVKREMPIPVMWLAAVRRKSCAVKGLIFGNASLLRLKPRGSDCGVMCLSGFGEGKSYGDSAFNSFKSFKSFNERSDK